jgi:NAD dependent epimerase/dehydratase
LNWKNKRVLVTGAGGFIGSHLAQRLVELGASTRALVHYNAPGTWGWLDQSPIRDEVEVVAGDICDRDSLFQAMQGTEIVFHLAALIAIPYSYHAPVSYVRTNVEGTLNVLQAARKNGVKLVVHTSTSEVYGTARYVPIDEAHPLQGQSPYSASKIGADKIAEAFHLSFDLPVTIVRPFNTFGPRQSDRAVVPTIITQCLKGETVSLGNLHPTRDLNYVANTVEGFLLAASTPESVGKTINLGTGKEITVGELAQLIARLAGRTINIHVVEQRIRPPKSEVERLVANNRLARTVLGWEPAVSLEMGLKKTIEWMHEHLGRYRPGVYAV